LLLFLNDEGQEKGGGERTKKTDTRVKVGLALKSSGRGRRGGVRCQVKDNTSSGSLLRKGHVNEEDERG